MQKLLKLLKKTVLLEQFLKEEGGFLTSKERRILNARQKNRKFKSKEVNYAAQSSPERGNYVLSRQRKKGREPFHVGKGPEGEIQAV